MKLAATLPTLGEASNTWDVIVVGAGPAGSVTALDLARRGARVLLVDRSEFPRGKVCGGCLSARGRAVLARLGLGDLPERLGAVSLVETRLFARGRCAPLRWPGGVALSREALDSGLIAAAIEAGAHFLPGTLAHLSSIRADSRELSLQRGEESATVCARVVVAADGLSGSLTARSGEAPARVAPGSRVGAGCTFADNEGEVPPGAVFMACGRGGYVGLVRLEDGRLNSAAALDRSAIQRRGGPGRAAAAILEEAGAPVPAGLADAMWRGTPPLTRTRPRPWAERLFVAGDAAGYYEPFTGEGLAWAMESAVELAPLAWRAVRTWRPELGRAWSRRHRRVVSSRLLRCAAFALRRPRLAAGMVALFARWPTLAAPFSEQ